VSGTLSGLADAVAAMGGLLAGAVRRPAGPGEELGRLAAVGPRAAGQEEDYAQIVEAVYEGFLLHYRSGRFVVTGDPDLTLLAGDRLYALGLSRLADLGDLDAVATLADVISGCAQAEAEGDPARADAVWRAGAEAVGGEARGRTHSVSFP